MRYLTIDVPVRLWQRVDGCAYNSIAVDVVDGIMDTAISGSGSGSCVRDAGWRASDAFEGERDSYGWPQQVGGVSGLEVACDAVGIDDRELFEGFLPVRDFRAFDEVALGLSLGRSAASSLFRAVAGPFVFDVAGREPEQLHDRVIVRE